MQYMNTEIRLLKTEAVIKIGPEICVYFPYLGTLNLQKAC